MNDPKNGAKAEKKSTKALVKLEKQRGKRNLPGGKALTGFPDTTAGPELDGNGGRTPAERSAAAAERQVLMQQYRIWIALITALVAVATLLATIQPWRWLGPSDGGADTKPASPNRQPAED